MAQLRLALAVQCAEAFLDVVPGHLAIGGEEIGSELGDLEKHRAADLQRRLVELLLRSDRGLTPL